MTDNVWMVISIDSDSESSTTDEREDILAIHGFSKLSPNKGIRLPESTYIGLISDSEAGTTKVDEIWDDLKLARLEPRRIFGRTIDEWKVIRSRKDKD